MGDDYDLKDRKRKCEQCDQKGRLCFSIFGHFQQWKFALKYIIFAKVDSKFRQMLKDRQPLSNVFKILSTQQNFAQSGHTVHILKTK